MKLVLSFYVSFSLITALPTLMVSKCCSVCGLCKVFLWRQFFSLRLSLLVFIKPVFILRTLSLKSTLNSEPRGRRKVRWLLCQPEEALKVGGACQQCGERGGWWFRGSLSKLMMLLAAITKASLTYTNAKVLPSPWGSGFDFLGCRPPLAHSDHSKERPRRRSLGQRRVFSRPVSLWLRGYISRNVVSSSDNEPHYPACVNVYARVASEKKIRVHKFVNLCQYVRLELARTDR